MKNKKLKKIIFETIAIIIVTLILAVNIQAESEKNPVKYKNDPEHQYCYFIIGWGYIGGITINDQEEEIGKLEGILHIWNTPGWSSPDYKLFIFDKNTNKLLNKKNLPEVFTLQGFVGFGYIKYVNIPHQLDATRYFLIGKAIDLLE
ncbi:hypothetical protein AYK20_02400 [Thermoplasmatales archaeon SG8-52-1]|nr:MAG: hypothetical protein AYK20_02400 [Thermoplasmatales archaeon SG8-52-1]